MWYCNGCKKNQQLFKKPLCGIAMDVKKINNYLGNLYGGIAMDVKKNQQLFRRPLCGYCNGCKKMSNYLGDLYVGIAMDYKKKTATI
jgi:hypothetical protein